MESAMERIIVIGTSGSGKSTLADAIARKRGHERIELDALHWDVGWTSRERGEFERDLLEAMGARRWVMDGNYSSVRALTWPEADTIVWLRYDLDVVMRRLLWRTIKRIVLREDLWGTNRESLRKALSRDSILVWALRTYWRHRREYPELFQREEHAHLRVVELPDPEAARRFLDEL